VKVPINRLEVNWKQWAAAKSLTATQQHTPVAYGGGPGLRRRRSVRCLNCMQLRCCLMSEFIDKFIDMLKWYCSLHGKRRAAQWPARRWLKTFLFLQILPTVAFLNFFRASQPTDSPDCLPILLSISLFYFLVVGSVRWIKLTHVSFWLHVKIESRIVS